MAPPFPHLVTAFLSVDPLEPVFVFYTADEAARFQSVCRQGRILPDQRSKWVFLPKPEGLLRVRTARGGDVGFDFGSHKEARNFNESVKGIGRIFGNSKDKPTWDRTVYFGPLGK